MAQTTTNALKKISKMKTEIKFKTIGTRAVVSKEITPAQAAEILQRNPPLTQVDTPTSYYPRP